MIRLFFGVLAIAGIGLATTHFAERVNDQLYLRDELQLDVYLTNNACVEALNYVEELTKEQANALLISNCLHSKAFRQSSVQWDSSFVLPPAIYTVGAHQLEQELTQWLQGISGVRAAITPEQFHALNLLGQSDVEHSLPITQFLCAHRDFFIKLPKPTPKTSWQQNQYALLNECIVRHRDYRRSGMEKIQFEYSTGASLLEMFGSAEADPRHFKDVFRTTQR